MTGQSQSQFSRVRAHASDGVVENETALSSSESSGRLALEEERRRLAFQQETVGSQRPSEYMGMRDGYAISPPAYVSQQELVPWVQPVSTYVGRDSPMGNANQFGYPTDNSAMMPYGSSPQPWGSDPMQMGWSQPARVTPDPHEFARQYDRYVQSRTPVMFGAGVHHREGVRGAGSRTPHSDTGTYPSRREGGVRSRSEVDPFSPPEEESLRRSSFQEQNHIPLQEFAGREARPPAVDSSRVRVPLA